MGILIDFYGYYFIDILIVKTFSGSKPIKDRAACLKHWKF